MKNLFIKIGAMIPSLPRAEKVFAEALLENPESITEMTLAAIARESGSSEASIVRFCKRMGYDGYTALKLDCILALSEAEDDSEEKIEISDNMTAILKKVYKSNIQTMSNTLALVDESCEAALQALMKARSIHFFGVGDAFAVCKMAQIKFSRLGIPCTADSDVMQQMITAANLTKKDVALAISYEGRSKNVVEAMKTAKKMGATTISITKMNKSPLLAYTDIKILIAVNDLTVSRDKVSRRVSDQFIIDALYLGYTTRADKKCKEWLRRSQTVIDSNKI